MSNAIINSLTTQYYGNYRGVIKKHGEHGKCKIFVPGVYHEELLTDPDSLPDAEPAQPLFAGGLNGNGIFQYPEIESMVWLFFENGDHNLPIYFASTLGGSEANKNFITDKYIIKTKSLSITIDDKNNEINIIENKNINITSGDTANIDIPNININSDNIDIKNSNKIDINSTNEINTTTIKLKIISPNIEILSSNINITGFLNINGVIINNGVNMTTHKHAHAGPIPGITNIPIN